jgi:hypothetical protein
MEKKIVKEHDQVRVLHELIHYPDHDARTESKTFKETKRELKADKEHWKCFIDNGYCSDGPLEVHHGLLEWATSNEIDWEKVKRDHPNIDEGVDDKDQMIVLCARHHRGAYVGIHECSYNAWILQKYMKLEALEKFETLVKKLTEGEKHE